jgi:hypothetical protein
MADEYATGYVVYQGLALSEVSDIDFDEESGDQEVVTILKGLAGHSNGAAKVKLTLKSAIPAAGMEVDFAEICRKHRTIEVRFRCAGVEATAQGRVMNAKRSVSANNPSALDVTFNGKVTSSVRV